MLYGAFSAHLVLLTFASTSIALERSPHGFEDKVSKCAKRITRFITSNDNETNLIFSPLAIERQIVLTIQAARGDTLENLKKAIELENVDDAKIVQIFSKMPHHDFYCIDHVYYRTELNLRSTFRIILDNFFDVSAKAIAFEDATRSVDQINEAFSKETWGSISDYFSEDDIEEEAPLYFLNAAYFKGHWSLPFSKQYTSMRAFYNWGTTKTLVKSFYGVQNVGYASFDDLKTTAIELSYTEDSYMKLLILLPNIRNGLPALQQQLARKDFKTIVQQLNPKTITLAIPHFRVDYRIDSAKLIEKLIGEEFIGKPSDFSNGLDTISTSSTPRIFHKACFDVNEYGSLVDGEEPDQQNTENVQNSATDNFFIVEHPFMFILHKDGQIQFIGRIVTFNITDNAVN